MAARKSMFQPAPARPEVEQLFDDARRNPPTDSELHAQRVSFAFGNAPVDAKGITKDTVEDSSRRIRMDAATSTRI